MRRERNRLSSASRLEPSPDIRRVIIDPMPTLAQHDPFTPTHRITFTPADGSEPQAWLVMFRPEPWRSSRWWGYTADEWATQVPPAWLYCVEGGRCGEPSLHWKGQETPMGRAGRVSMGRAQPAGYP